MSKGIDNNVLLSIVAINAMNNNNILLCPGSAVLDSG